METRIRIISDGPRSAAFNMAADMRLLSACAEKPGIVLRFYQWETPSVSIGCAQDPQRILDHAAMARDGLVWIRRPTGGRAVLHHEDVTYSFVFSRTIAAMGAGIAETYHRISQCLIEGLRRLGVDCDAHPFFVDASRITRETKLPCFLAPNRSEIMVGGRKLIGSAQKRAAGAVLQHGSLPISPKFRDLPVYQRTSDAEKTAYARLLRERCACLQECLPQADPAAVVDSLIAGFTAVLPFVHMVEGWSDHEERAVTQFVESDEFRHAWMQ